MILRTSCKDCIFSDNGCIVGKNVFNCDDLNGRQLTLGLCGYKKDDSWKSDIIKGYPNDDLVKLSAGEYNTLTILTTIENTTCIKCKTKNILTKLLSLGKHPMVKHFIISTYQKDRSNFKYVLDYLDRYCTIPWTLDSLMEEPVGLKEQLDYSSRLVKTYWTATLDPTKRLNKTTIDVISEILNDSQKNPVSFYFNEQDNVNLVYPTSAFQQMQGNDETWWFEKIKTFDNWKDVSHKIV